MLNFLLKTRQDKCAANIRKLPMVWKACRLAMASVSGYRGMLLTYNGNSIMQMQKLIGSKITISAPSTHRESPT